MKLSIKNKKLAAIAVFTPWTPILYGIYKLIDAVSHMFGGCIGH